MKIITKENIVKMEVVQIEESQYASIKKHWGIGRLFYDEYTVYYQGEHFTFEEFLNNYEQFFIKGLKVFRKSGVCLVLSNVERIYLWTNDISNTIESFNKFKEELKEKGYIEI